MTYFKGISDEKEWQGLCEAWIEHEGRLQFPDGSKANRLSTEQRPDEVGWWIKDRRKYEKPPPLTDLRLFGASWKAWWQGLQPDWRQASWPPSQVQVAETQDEWEGLDKGGRNGIFVVVLTLSWWWSSAVDAGTSMDEVKVAVEDVRWVMGVMAKVLGKRPSNVDQASPRKRCKRS